MSALPQSSMEPVPFDTEGERAIERFEAAWRAGDTAPDLSQFVASVAACAPLVVELIAIDLEFRWRRALKAADNGGPAADATSRPAPRIDEYARLLEAHQATPEQQAHLIAEEYRARHRWGDRPEHAEYRQRFADRFPDLGHRLEAVDRALGTESDQADSSRPQVPAARTAVSELIRWSDRDFVIEQHLGRGGVGRVYRAMVKQTRETVALKILTKASQADERAVRRMIEEAHCLSRLDHPGIVRFHGLGQMSRGGLFLVLEYVDGPDLNTVAAGRPIPAEMAVAWICCAAQALQHAHDRQIVHCDLKPANLLRDQDGAIRVTDFGLAARLNAPHEGPLAAGGTLGFMAPEQLDPRLGPVDPRSDVFGLAATLCALATARPPCRAAMAAEVLESLLEREHLARLSEAGELPPPVRSACLRALDPFPSNRFNSVREFAASLGEALDRERLK